ncbi:uncharacterized protein EI90DRAFT_3018116 [Cantharellus anzutake]|uniref:uncharacterized protein n=1 Tax=Cantharellus anzutake TaxID=1750568 RepID=UPI00190416D5|nr:uncharacterized protein EI90DRAFT_3018116 [Cantharellus anzutake]KAF8327628.1 hypothetical protein EI90DRAFT_3018116 [Cantharellus anzutake]
MGLRQTLGLSVLGHAVVIKLRDPAMALLLVQKNAEAPGAEARCHRRVSYPSKHAAVGPEKCTSGVATYLSRSLGSRVPAIKKHNTRGHVSHPIPLLVVGLQRNAMVVEVNAHLQGNPQYGMLSSEVGFKREFEVAMLEEAGNNKYKIHYSSCHSPRSRHHSLSQHNRQADLELRIPPPDAYYQIKATIVEANPIIGAISPDPEGFALNEEMWHSPAQTWVIALR